MGKGHAQHSDADTADKGTNDVDVDAEHRPDTARKASNAALAREANKNHAAPTQAYADQSVIHSVQSHVKLAAARMRAGAAQINSALAAPRNDGAGDDQAMNFIQDQIAAVNSDLENVQNEITHASSVTNGTMNVELGELNGAFHGSWVPALQRVYSRTHDANLDLLPQYQGYNLTVGPTIDRLRFLYQAAGVDPTTLKGDIGPRITDPAKAVEQRDEELQAAEMEALHNSMYSTEVALDLVSSDLKVASFDQARVSDLTRSVEELVNVLEPINPAHIGKVAKLPALVAKIQAMQAQVDGMTDEHGQALASRIGTHAGTFSTGLRRILAKVGAINAAHKASAKHH